MIGEQTETSDKARHTPWMVETGRKVEITACDNHDCRGRIDRLRHSFNCARNRNEREDCDNGADGASMDERATIGKMERGSSIRDHRDQVEKRINQ